MYASDSIAIQYSGLSCTLSGTFTMFEFGMIYINYIENISQYGKYFVALGRSSKF